MSGVDQCLGVETECTVETNDSEGSRFKVRVLLIVRVRCMIGRENRQCSISDSVAKRFHVFGGSQWRVHLGGGVVSIACLIGEEQVVG